MKEVATMHALQNPGPSRSRLPVWGLIKRSLVSRVSRARHRCGTGVPDVAGCLRAGFGVFVVGPVFGSSLGRARFGFALLS